MKKYLTVVLPASPFVYSRPAVLKSNLIIIGLLSVQLAVLVFFADWYALFNIAAAVTGTLFTECAVHYLIKGNVRFSTQAAVTGLLTGFFMPVQIGVVFVFFLSALSVFISKTVFGGTGYNWVNPTAVAVCMAAVSHPESFAPAVLNHAFINGHDSFFQALEAGGFLKIKGDASFTSLLNSLFLHSVGVTLPEGYISLFVHSSSVIPAFRYNLLTLASSVVLFSFKIADYVLPACFLAVYALCVRIFAQVPVTGLYFSGDILAALLTGGILFSAFFVLTEHSSAPKTAWGKAACGSALGLCTFFICGAGSSPAGVMFAVLFVNALTPLLERAEVLVQVKKRKRYE